MYKQVKHMKQKDRNRPLLTVTIDKNILNTFNILTGNDFINKSKLIESFMVNWIKNKENDNIQNNKPNK